MARRLRYLGRLVWIGLQVAGTLWWLWSIGLGVVIAGMGGFLLSVTGVATGWTIVIAVGLFLVALALAFGSRGRRELSPASSAPANTAPEQTNEGQAEPTPTQAPEKFPPRLKPPLKTSFSVVGSKVRESDVELLVRVGLMNAERHDVTHAVVNFLVPDTIPSMGYADEDWNIIQGKGRVSTASEYPAHGGVGPTGSRYWMEREVRISGRVSTLFHFRLVIPKESADYPVLLRVVSEDLPHPYEATGNVGFHLPDEGHGAEKPKEAMTPYERLKVLHDEGRLLLQELTATTLGINIDAMISGTNKVAKWTSEVRRELKLVAPDLNVEWVGEVAETDLTAKGLKKRLELLGGILSRLKGKER